MSDALARLARSDDWSERARAARLVARSDAADQEALALQLLRDPDSTAVSEAMVASLLEVRREGAIRLILRSLGRPDGAPPDECDQCLLEGLLTSELDGVEVRGAIVSVVLETHVRDELLGALAAIAWLAPGGGFPAPPQALDLVSSLAEDSSDVMRKAARQALAALGASPRQPGLES
jgi:HEAT repeat protein